MLFPQSFLPLTWRERARRKFWRAVHLVVELTERSQRHELDSGRLEKGFERKNEFHRRISLRGSEPFDWLRSKPLSHREKRGPWVREIMHGCSNTRQNIRRKQPPGGTETRLSPMLTPPRALSNREDNSCLYTYPVIFGTSRVLYYHGTGPSLYPFPGREHASASLGIFHSTPPQKAMSVRTPSTRTLSLHNKWWE